MSTRSRFERQLNFRPYGFAIKIPDVGRGLKPFDYVVGMPLEIDGEKILRFVAIEAKTAKGWTLSVSKWQPHQRKALDIVESLAPRSAWVAIGFLDLPKMTFDYERKPIVGKLKKEAFLIRWPDYKDIEGETSCSYSDIIEHYPHYALEWGRVGSRYSWILPKKHPIFCKL